ncbi:MAG: galactose mutarotase [Clostridiales bacterium]|nr:galactose mutarotase [Clostridiales bacterium]
MGMITKKHFGQTAKGEDVFLFRLNGAGGAYVEALNYGAIWKTARVPGRNGDLVDVCLSYDDIRGYESDENYIGAVIGRYAGRIKAAAFTLGGATYSLQKNDGENSLHGGADSFGKRIWDFDAEGGALTLRLHSADGDQGYPGNLDISVTYSFCENNENNSLTIDYMAKSDRDTPISLTNHAYFNLAGASSGKSAAMAHVLNVNASTITEVGEDLTETGRLLQVSGAPYDFRTGFAVGERIGAADPQLLIAGGYDINYVVCGTGLREAATLASQKSGISLRLMVTNPCLQFYSGNSLLPPFAQQSALCLEPQSYPDAVNNPAFPSGVLKAGELYAQRSVYQFRLLP